MTRERPHPHRARRRLSSFGHALSGIRHVVATQPNFRSHLAAAAAALALGGVLGISRVEWIGLVLVIALVMVCEMVNTVLELTMDRISEQFHPLAKAAKDVAAGSVLVAAVASLAVGALIFVPRLAALIRGDG